MDYRANPRQYFEITKVSRQKNKVTVEDKALGLVFEIYGPDGEWDTVEIYNNYFIRFIYVNKRAVVIEFME